MSRGSSFHDLPPGDNAFRIRQPCDPTKNQETAQLFKRIPREVENIPHEEQGEVNGPSIVREQRRLEASKCSDSGPSCDQEGVGDLPKTFSEMHLKAYEYINRSNADVGKQTSFPADGMLENVCTTAVSAPNVGDVCSEEQNEEDSAVSKSYSQGHVLTVKKTPVENCSDTITSPATVSEAVSILIDNLMDRAKDEEVQIRVMRSLRRLSVTQDGRDLIGNSGGMSLVADSMRRFPSSSTLVTTCCMVIANLAFNHQENKDRARKCKAIDIMIEILTRQNLTADQNAYVCLAIRNVSSGYRVNQAYLSANGCVAGLCKAMSRYPLHLELQVQAAAALGNIANTNKTSQMYIRESGGIQLIINAMRNHPDQLALLESAMIAIRNLSVSNDRNQRFIGSLGGGDQIVLAMKSLPEISSVQVRGCAALRYLALDEKNREQFGVNGGIPAVVNALNLVRTKADEVVEVMRALANCTFDHRENKMSAVRCNSIGVTCSLLGPSNESTVLECGFRVLRNLTDTSSNARHRIREEGGVALAIECLRQRRPEEGVGEHIFAMLLNILSDTEQADAFCHDFDLDELEDLTSAWMEALIENMRVKQHGSLLISIIRRLKGSLREDWRNTGRKNAVTKVSNLLRKLSRLGSQVEEEPSWSPRST